MVEVLCYILGTVEKDDMRVVVRDIKGAMLSHEEFIASYERQEENTPLVMNELQQHTVAFQKHEEVTMHLNTKEASGSALLGTFMLCVSDALRTLCPTSTFKIDHQFNVYNAKTYTGDSALLSALLVSSRRRVVPCFVVQYKPRVSQDLADQDPFHLSEVAYYLRKMHKHPILH